MGKLFEFHEILISIPRQTRWGFHKDLYYSNTSIPRIVPNYFACPLLELLITDEMK